MKLFDLGLRFVSHSVFTVLGYNEVIHILHRHANGDWGNVYDELAEHNVTAIESDDYIMSVYYVCESICVIVITDCFRFHTRVFLSTDVSPSRDGKIDYCLIPSTF